MGETGTTPGNKGQFPGYDVLGQAPHWDEVTRTVVLARLGPRPPVRFFTPSEEAVARPLLDRLLAQDDEPRVPVFEVIDARLADGLGYGFHYDTLPEDGEAWRRTLAYLESDAQAKHQRPFHELGRSAQKDLLEAVRRASDPWHALPAAHVWNLWMRYALAAFYTHPWAWNEMGFGGPAYPRGYKNLGTSSGSSREPWEEPEANAQDPVPWAQRVEQSKRDHGA